MELSFVFVFVFCCYLRCVYLIVPAPLATESVCVCVWLISVNTVLSAFARADYISPAGCSHISRAPSCSTRRTKHFLRPVTARGNALRKHRRRGGPHLLTNFAVATKTGRLSRPRKSQEGCKLELSDFCCLDANEGVLTGDVLPGPFVIRRKVEVV